MGRRLAATPSIAGVKMTDDRGRSSTLISALLCPRAKSAIFPPVKTFVRASILAILLALQTLAARAVEPIEPPVASREKRPPAPVKAPDRIDNQPRVFEFSADEIGVVLRVLARQAKMNIVISETVKGAVTMRLEDKTPREAIEVICKANDLEIQELDGVHYIRGWDDLLKADSKRMAQVVKLMLDAYLEKGFTRVEAMELIKSPHLPRIELPATKSAAKPARR